MIRGDIELCPECDARVEIVRDWRRRRIALEVKPAEWSRVSYVETELGEFAPVYRHKCVEKPKPPPCDGRELRPKLEKKPRVKVQPSPQLNLFR